MFLLPVCCPGVLKCSVCPVLSAHTLYHVACNVLVKAPPRKSCPSSPQVCVVWPSAVQVFGDPSVLKATLRHSPNSPFLCVPWKRELRQGPRAQMCHQTAHLEADTAPLAWQPAPGPSLLSWPTGTLRGDQGHGAMGGAGRGRAAQHPLFLPGGPRAWSQGEQAESTL